MAWPESGSEVYILKMRLAERTASMLQSSRWAAAQRHTFGNSGRNVLIGPGLSNLDFALMKIFKLRHEQMLQFRVEVFNFFNHPNFKLPESYIDNSATFGRVLAAEPARQIQFGLKYLF